MDICSVIHRVCHADMQIHASCACPAIRVPAAACCDSFVFSDRVSKEVRVVSAPARFVDPTMAMLDELRQRAGASSRPGGQPTAGAKATSLRDSDPIAERLLSSMQDGLLQRPLCH